MFEIEIKTMIIYNEWKIPSLRLNRLLQLSHVYIYICMYMYIITMYVYLKISDKFLFFHRIAISQRRIASSSSFTLLLSLRLVIKRARNHGESQHVSSSPFLIISISFYLRLKNKQLCRIRSYLITKQIHKIYAIKIRCLRHQ